MQEISRRGLLLGGLAVVGTGALAACSNAPGTTRTNFAAPARLRPLAGQRVVQHQLTAKATSLDLGGTTVDTWAFGDTAPGPLIRATAGDLLRIRVDNQLPTDTSVHWHGIALRNIADGVPGLTQDPIAAGSSYLYEFTAPDPGTYFYHPHVGVQLDRGLYAPLVIDDPHEPGNYDLEWVVVLDDWIDGTGRTPDDVLADLTAASGDSSDSMGGMDMGHMSMGGNPPFGDAGDVTYPHYLINGRVPTAPDTLCAKPGQRVRLRIINSGSDTIFTVALGGHRLTVTHTDGFPVQPHETGALYIGMGERYDATVTLGDGVFPLVAVPYGKEGQAMALLRTSSGAAPAATVHPAELDGPILEGAELLPAEASRLSSREPDSNQMVHLSGQMMPYRWAINGAPYGKNDPLLVNGGDRVRLQMMNMTQMTHPMHIHGHTFALPSGLRKDTVLVKPMSALAVDLQADNPGNWMTHCHNIYHAEAGMMISLNYRS
ncbi:multicopper oxidase family protein [Nocardioides zhouii]|uniref:Multicopper oxidase family protein n=1 Tax=Nocardioides zhouii TaxID=1168729 RepID=A0A4Q2SIG8_9ACTN|nr:multicopper oxidase family protein [Nocardioides zhouii]RYC03810.1 multicopper oxidase family protein [Nocardioides zhouii]